MASLTEHFGLQRLGPNDQFSTNGYKFLDADRVTIDRLLWQASGGHTHTGTAGGGLANPATPVSLTLSVTGGAIPGGVRVYYKYTWVDFHGNETAGSPETFVDTPSPVASPAAPSLVRNSSGGTLLPGDYFYVLSAYTPTSTQETRAVNFANISITSGTTNSITINFPSLPAGAAGWNVYRRKPGGARYLHVATVSAGPTSIVDNGALTEDCDRTLPTANTTNASNTITATLPTAVPVGYTWKLYRTYQAGEWTNKLLHHVVEETTEASGIIRTNWIDVGTSTEFGTPPTTNQQTFAQPSKILLTDKAEVQGRAPLSAMSAFPYVLSFSMEGQVRVRQGLGLWTCEFPKARIIGCRAVLGVGSSPVAANVIIDVNKGTGTTPTPTTIYTTQSTRPQVLVGQRVGARAVPQIIELVEGDTLSIDVDQAGGGATPNDKNLTVQVFMYLYGWTDPASMVW